MKKMLIVAGALLMAAGVQAAQDPEAVFNRSCGMCHNGQLPQSPKKGDVAAWEPRMAQGMELMVKHVTEGFNAMPAKGMCMDCTAEDFQAVIEWMAK